MAFILLTPLIAVEAVEVAVAVTTAVAVTVTVAKVVEKTIEVTKDIVDYLERDSSPPTNVFTTNTLTISDVSCYEVRTIYDWWGNGLSGEERQRLLDLGYNERTEHFGLRRLRDVIYNAEKAPGRPPVNAPGWERPWKPPKNWDGKMKKVPNGEEKGYPHKDGSVWVSTGKRGHGGAHWDINRPHDKSAQHENVYEDGTTRFSKKK